MLRLEHLAEQSAVLSPRAIRCVTAADMSSRARLPERRASKNVGQGGTHLASADHCRDRSSKVSADPLALPDKVAPQDLVVLAFLVETLPAGVQRVHSVEPGQNDDLPGDLAKGGLRCSRQQRLRPQESGIADGDAPDPDGECPGTPQGR